MGRLLIFRSPLGPMVLVATEQGISDVLLRPSEEELWLATHFGRGFGSGGRVWRYLEKLNEQLAEYFAGKRTSFSVPLDLSMGTDFQQRVWRACIEIPFGEVRSYAELAQMAGSPPGAARGVGLAMGANPMPIVVPCHRVIRSDGSLGGFSAGLRWKRMLLRLERKTGDGAGRP